MDNIKNLKGLDSIEKMRELVDKVNIGMLCTKLSHFPFSVRPMAAHQVDDEGNIWFMSVRNGEHNADIKKDNRVQLIFAHPGSSDYLSVSGTAEIVEDPEKVKELWTPIAKVWFPEGKDDPNITLIKVATSDGYYWDTKSNKMVAMLKMAASIVVGRTMDDSIEGEIKV